MDSQGEFNSGKSTVINALLGERYLKEGVVPTTNEITFLRYSDLDGKDLQRCERHPDGQLICYLPAPILKEVSPFGFSSFCTLEFKFRDPWLCQWLVSLYLLTIILVFVHALAYKHTKCLLV